jgi:hypothetical protein
MKFTEVFTANREESIKIMDATVNQIEELVEETNFPF